MTPPLGVELKEPKVNWRNFESACKLAKQTGVTTVMFTGKGEPTLFPKQITKFLRKIRKHGFPLIELQTNGIKIADKDPRCLSEIDNWYDLGMTTVAVSIVHFDPEKNREVYLPYRKTYIDLPALISYLHVKGFAVRLTCIAANGFIDSSNKLVQLLEFARTNQVEQLTLTPVNKPSEIIGEEVSFNNCQAAGAQSNNPLPPVISEARKAWLWTNEHHLTDKQQKDIFNYVQRNGSPVLTLAHGAVIYDIGGQNLCLNQCLTVQPEAKEMRNLIFFPDGHARYYWQYPGAIIF